jgi:predicted transcriptional regulator
VEVLRALIEMERATANQLHDAMAASKPWAHSTVVTFLRRLEAKGLVEHTRPKDSRAFVFRPTRRARATRRRLLGETIDRLFGGDPMPLVASLIEEDRFEPEQIEELRRMLDRRAAGGRRSR